ncbi:hypothetical protein F383_25495 [Gossypium arboreum]|uniref:Uncharacterized protein n=1 Tax=Gossypium arboreum TaxID=29729 RepID=A0A0B0NXK1_GOSAR|nr:hypothetical protein F383_25495 [Gossypium arboreum]
MCKGVHLVVSELWFSWFSD